MTATRWPDRSGRPALPGRELQEGADLRRRRRALGLTQVELAEHLGVSPNTVARWERGELGVSRPRQVAGILARLERGGQVALGRQVGERPAPGMARAAIGLADASVSPSRHNLPTEFSSFVGRQREIDKLASRLGAARLVTLVGPGGVGKTRLALQVGACVRGGYSDGVWLVELAPHADPHMVASAVAASLGIHERGRTPLARTLADTLRDQHLLLILDNCEHVLPGCAELAHDLLRACPDLRLLATSREPLRVGGEVRWPVAPLSILSPTDASTQASEAVELFVERACAVDPDFALTDANREVIAEVCERLDGLPLAIELAAARVRSLPVRALLDQLQSVAGGLPFLTGGPRDSPARHHTLRATIAWSYELLDQEERALFCRLAPFRGCSFDAVEAMCVGISEGPRSASLDLPPIQLDARDGLASLVDKSLLHMEEDEQGHAFYVMLQTVREFALERLEATPECDAVWRRHAWYYLKLLQLTDEQSELEPPAMRQDVLVNRLEREHGNFRAALDWCQAQGYGEASLRLGVGLLWFWGVRGHIAEGRRRLEELLRRFPLRTASGTRSFVHARALDALGRMATMQGDLESALDFEQRSLELFEGLGSAQGICAVLEGMAFIAHQQGYLDLARCYFERSLSILRSAQSAGMDPTIQLVLRADALTNLGLIAHDQGDDEVAIAHFQESIRLADAIYHYREADPVQPHPSAPYLSLAAVLRDMGDHDRARRVAESTLKLIERSSDRRAEGLMLADLGCTAAAQRDFPSAFDFLSRSLRLYHELGELSGIAFVLDRFAYLASAQGQPERALRLSGAAAALRARVGMPPPLAAQQQIDRQIESARRTLGRLSTIALAAGGQLTLDEAIAEAWATAPMAAASELTSATTLLSSRERQVAVLVAHGYKNRQIAVDLVVSEGTVATHVRHILTKLELRSRAQIAVWVAQNGLFDEPALHAGGNHAAVPR